MGLAGKKRTHDAFVGSGAEEESAESGVLGVETAGKDEDIVLPPSPLMTRPACQMTSTHLRNDMARQRAYMIDAGDVEMVTAKAAVGLGRRMSDILYIIKCAQTIDGAYENNREYTIRGIGIAINLLDRYKVSTEGLIGTKVHPDDVPRICLIIAQKNDGEECNEYAGIRFTDFKVSQEIGGMKRLEQAEARVLAALHWRLNPPTAHGFAVDLIELARRRGLGASIRERLVQFTVELLNKSACDAESLAILPSHVAIVCVRVASVFVGCERELATVLDSFINLHPDADQPTEKELAKPLERLHAMAQSLDLPGSKIV